MNPLQRLSTLGQSIWLDYIRRDLLDSGAFAQLIERDRIVGVTSNPAIFRHAIADSHDYDGAITVLMKNGLDDEQVYEHLAVADVRQAADQLRAVYTSSAGADGYVSLEVAPALAQATDATIVAAQRLWEWVRRPNLMIKVPATPQGLPALEQLVADGINVNVTLIFALPVYEQVAEYYLRGLERRLANGQDLRDCASVASFFISRIDTAVDALVDSQLGADPDPSRRERLQATRGKTAIACARLAYRRWQAIFAGPRWQRLAEAGARPQRLLWASTGTKNPDYSDVLYVESLIGAHTVNTLPPATLDAFRDHGQARATLELDLNEATQILDNLTRLGLDLAPITAQLLSEGLHQFEQAYLGLLRALADTRAQAT